MTIANQISLGALMALIPYVLWNLTMAVVRRFTRWGAPVPVDLGAHVAQVKLHAVTVEDERTR